MKKALALLVAAALLPAFASAEERARTAGRLLSESLGARPAGMAEAGTALVGDLNALSFNPAGLPFMKRAELQARFQTSEGSVDSGVLAYGRRHGPFAWGMGAAYMDAGTVGLSFSNGTQYSRDAQKDVAGQLSMGLMLFDGFSLGGGGRVINSSIVEEYNATSFAVDAGVVLTPFKGLRLAASLRNFGADLVYRDEGDPLPGESRVGLSYSYSPRGRSPEDPASDDDWYYRDESETPIFTLFADGVRDRNGETSGAGAIEITRWPKAAFRAGYGWGENAAGLTLGFGVNLVRYSLDYAYRFVEDLSDAHRLSFSFYWE